MELGSSVAFHGALKMAKNFAAVVNKMGQDSFNNIQAHNKRIGAAARRSAGVKATNGSAGRIIDIIA